MVASAFPLTQVILAAYETKGSSSASGSSAKGPGLGQGAPATGDFPFGPVRDPNAANGAPGAGAAGAGSSASRPGVREASSGSMLIDQLVGAARMMGYDPKLPDLPLAQLAPVNPLRAAILAWIAATNADVPADELTRELARADLLPQETQRDLAILVLSASQATLLQKQALAALSPAQIAWLSNHPEVAADMARGVATDDTRTAALLAGLVDTPKSIEATLLLLEAIEATRGSLSQAQKADATKLLQSPGLDAQSVSILSFLTSAGSASTDAQKVRFAAELIARTSNVPLPASVPSPSFGDAVAQLMAATNQRADASALASVLDRASQLPPDLQEAIAGPLAAEARAVRAADPLAATPTSQPEALMGVLLAVADALPTLEKYSLYWSQTPDKLRIGQWDVSARAGWAVEHAALVHAAGGDPISLVRAGGLLHGADLQDASVPQRSFADAFAALETQRGHVPTPETIESVRAAGEKLDPSVRDAAARMMSGAAESARLSDLAFAKITSDERLFLLEHREAQDLFLRPQLTDEQLSLLQTYSVLARQVDRAKITAAGVVGIRATVEAKDILGAVKAQSADVRPFTAWDALARLLPWGSARAQGGPVQGFDPTVCGSGVVETACGNDIIIQIRDPFATGAADTTLLRISGTGSSQFSPERFSFPVCFGTGTGSGPCTVQTVSGAKYGAPNVWIDLGGDDVYNTPVASTYINEPTPVSLHLDMGGRDVYADPTPNYPPGFSFFGPWGQGDTSDPNNPNSASRGCISAGACVVGLPAGARAMGPGDGYPTEGSALGSGVAVLMDAQGNDEYDAQSYSQGFGQWGVGVLADLGGNDVYKGERFVQGSAGRDLNAGIGVLVDGSGDDKYTAETGQGYGLGGVFVDGGGRDRYQNTHAPFGLPVFHLNVLPGGNVTTLDQRRDDANWLDGPGQLNIGLGVDTETSGIAADDADHDGAPAFEEFVFGTDPNDPHSNPQSTPGARADALAHDSDGDTYPDFIERALSTDPNDARSYPVGIPRGPTFVLPNGLLTLVAGDQVDGLAGAQPQHSDKILDLRLPLQKAGTLDFACTGPMQSNVTLPLAGGENLFPLGGYTSPGKPADQGPCLMVTYSSNGNGEGKVNSPTSVASASMTDNPGQLVEPKGAGQTDKGVPMFNNASYHVPAGILAIGDAVDTSYTVDYFFVLDIGGDDTFHGHTGGALPVTTKPTDLGSTSPADTDGRYRTFFAPSLVLNVDVGSKASATGVTVANANDTQGFDTYLPAIGDSPDDAQGAFWGVLVDTTGNDKYVGGNASQGAEGGILLDLEGADSYRAVNLSQGATVVAAPDAASDGIGQDGHAKTDSLRSPTGGSPTTDSGVRHAVPGILLDLGSGKDTYVAGMDSQGFARGFESTGNDKGLAAVGLLLDQGGDDRYLTTELRGANVQGVGTIQGLGALVDLQGRDTYAAWGSASQGATISQSYGTAAGQHSTPGAGVLLDLNGFDAYSYTDASGVHSRTSARQDQLTVTRGALETSSTGDKVQAAPGVHLDCGRVPVSADTASPSVQGAQATAAQAQLLVDDCLGAVLGTGTSAFAGAPTDATLDGFFVNMPNARLAIGDTNATTYDKEYALVIDLGGDNVYHMNAGGLVPSQLYFQGSADSPTSTRGSFGGVHPQLATFPVSLVFDAGSGSSTYDATHGLVQGAGYFGVGVLADLGGADQIRVSQREVPSFGLGWMTTPPIVDGTIGEREWQGVAAKVVTLVGQRDPGVTEPLTMRVANDERNVYFAIRGHTASKDADRKLDSFTIDLNPGHGGDVNNTTTGQTGIDQIFVKSIANCEVLDRRFDTPTNSYVNDFKPLARNDVTAACLVDDKGDFTLELKKPIRVVFPRDRSDLDLRYDDRLGYLERTLGVHVEQFEQGAQETFAWPAGTVDTDGAGDHRAAASASAPDLSDEIAEWGAAYLANLGQPGARGADQPPITLSPALSQGAGIAGVGVLAMLGAVNSDANVTASDRAQGYGAFGGIGVVFDAGGSDRYVADTFAQGAAETSGMGLFLEMDGNDNYVNDGRSVGYTDANTQAAAAFLDLGGSDQYPISYAGCVGPSGSSDCHTPTAVNDFVAWQQNGGIGIDFVNGDPVRNLLLRNTGAADRLFGAQRTTLVLRAPDCGAALTTAATGLVCLDATVNLDTPDTTGTVSVDSVDFLVDGHRFASLANSSGKPQGRTAWRFHQMLDASALPDGAFNVTAVALLRATTDGRTGDVLFNDATPGSILVVDNPASGALCLAPKLDVTPQEESDRCRAKADAVFSPFATTSTSSLAIGWNVTRDANENPLELKDGYAPLLAGTNVPCDQKTPPADPAAVVQDLCSFLPFWILGQGNGGVGQDPSPWTTTPPGYTVYDPRAVVLQTSGPAKPVHQETRDLQAPMTIVKSEGLHVNLAGRTPIFTGTYETRVVVTLQKDGADTGVVLADQPFSAAKTITPGGVGSQLLPSFEMVRTNARTAIGLVTPAVRDDPLRLVLDQVSSECASLQGSSSLASGATCGVIYGNPQIVGVSCDSSIVPGLPPQAPRPPVALPSLRQTPACDGSVSVAGELIAARDASESQDLWGQAADAADGSLNPVSALLATDAGGLNWTDMYVTLRDVPPGTRGVVDDGKTITIQPGYGFAFKLFTQLESGLPQRVTLRSVAQTVVDLLNDKDNGAFRGPLAGPPLDPALCDQAAASAPAASVCRAELDGFNKNTWATARDSVNKTPNQGPAAVDGLVGSLDSLPVAVFRTGTSADLSRLDIKIPAKGSTSVAITIEDGAKNVVATPLPAQTAAGDVRGTPTQHGSTVQDGRAIYGYKDNDDRYSNHTIRFDGRGADGSLLPDGVYVVHLHASDANGEAKAADVIAPMVLDRTLPSSCIAQARTTPEGSVTLDCVGTSGFAGLAQISGGTALPLHWLVPTENGPAASGVDGVWLYYKVGPAGAWRLVSNEPFPSSVDAYDLTSLDSTQSDYYFVTIARDRAGNVEGLQNGHVAETTLAGFAKLDAPDCLAKSSASEQQSCLVTKAFGAKLAQQGGNVDHIRIDATRPTASLTLPLGGRQLNVGGAETSYVKAGAPFRLAVCVGDPDGNGIGHVQFVFYYVDPSKGTVTPRPIDGAAAGACGPRGAGTRYESADWGLVDQDKTLYPDGAWTASADVYDTAGNRVQSTPVNLVLDSVAPTVRLVDPIYPQGQTAVKPGDLLTLRILATDAYGVADEAGSNGITFDVGSLNGTSIAKLCSKDAAIDASVPCVHRRPVPSEGVVYQEISLRVTKADVENGVHAIPVVVRDNAGNAVALALNVTVDFKKFTIDPASLRISDVSYDSVVLHWNTSEATTGLVRYGVGQLDHRSAQNATPTKEHAIKVEGLSPSTRATFRAVSSTPGGFTNESDAIDATTITALFLDATSPRADQFVSGSVPVRFHGGLRGSTDLVTYSLETCAADCARPDATWTFYTTSTEQGDEHTLMFNSSRYLDGPTYSLRLNASAGKDLVSVVIGPLLSDNTAPEISVLSPVLATNDTTPRVIVEARDNLAGFGNDAATLAIDGAPVTTGLSQDPHEGTLRLAYDVPSALSPGVHAFALDVVDRAGNRVQEAWNVSVDGDAPAFGNATVRYAPGSGAGRLGGSVTVNVTATDASGVASLVADTSAVGTAPSTRLDHVRGTDYYVGTFTLAAADASATRRVALVATDLAGNAALSGVDVTIDNVAPRVSDARVAKTAQTKADVTLDASEPVLLVGTAVSPGVPSVSASTTDADARPTLTFAGLFPSRAYTFQLRAIDRAGNEVVALGKLTTDLDTVKPTRVAALTVQDLLDGTLRLSWSEATDDVAIAGYRVLRSDDGGATFAPIADVQGTTYDDKGLPLEATYVYKVVALDYGSNQGPASDALRASATAVPTLTVGTVSPTVGSTATVFRYVVSYASPGGVAPAYVRVVLDGAAQDMKAQGDGTWVYETRLAPHKRDAPHTYAYEASDGRYTVRFPSDGSSLRGPLVSGDAGSQSAAAGIFGAQRVPLWGAAGFAVALLGAVAIVAVVVRRKKEGSK